MDRIPVRASVAIIVVLVALSASVAVASGSLFRGAGAQSDCSGGDDGTVFVTDSGLEVVHDGTSLDANPFVNDTTLSFSNVTVMADNNASVQVANATTDRLCITSVEPTKANLTLVPNAGPRLIVEDPLTSLDYGAVEYASSTSGTDLTYEAASEATLTVADSGLESGRTLEAVTVATDSVLDSGTVTADEDVSLVLPGGTNDVNLRYASDGGSGTPTPTAIPTPTPTQTATATQTPTATATATSAPTATVTATSTATSTPTSTATATATQTPTATTTATSTATAADTETSDPTAAATATTTPVPSESHEPTPSTAPTSTATPNSTPTATSTVDLTAPGSTEPPTDTPATGTGATETDRERTDIARSTATTEESVETVERMTGTAADGAGFGLVTALAAIALLLTLVPTRN